MSCGILFNHESPRRGKEFVTRKISHGVADIKIGSVRTLALGNLDARRDWGWAPEYVDAMWRMLQLERPCDLVIGTGETHSVQEFCEAAFSSVGLDWRDHVTTDSRFVRPAEVNELRADIAQAHRLLGWTARLRFADIARAMVAADLETVSVR